jgi:predicted alpha-1,2-mannosidase
LHPSDIADADGRVRGPTGQVIPARGGSYYSTLSLWDTFRGVHPLLTLIAPERVDGFVLTLLEHHKAMGYLPLWTAWGRETWTMIGNPALPVISDAVAKGFKGFSHAEALQAMVQTSTDPRPKAAAWAQREWADYMAYGYIPFDKISNESVSQTLELGIGDNAVARVARSLGKTDLMRTFEARAQGFRRLYDAETRMMRGRDSMGVWRVPFDPLTPTSPLSNPGDYTEANAWQYTLTPALHDPQGLIELMGGPKAFEEWLDQFFTVQAPGDNKHLGQEALIGQYAHGNEPSHHIAYLYAYTPSPWKGHARIAEIMRRFYTDKPSGITGNDDCGQMSAWYVLSTLGFYPVIPDSGEYVLGAPQVTRADIQLDVGRSLRIKAMNRGGNKVYAQFATLNGKPVNPIFLRHADITGGGELRITMREMPPMQQR